MIKYYDVIKKALKMLEESDKYAYFYGAKGQVLTDAVMTSLWNASPKYFNKYSAEQKKNIFDYSRGKIGYDCSGFVGELVGDKVYSMALKEHCPYKTTLYEGVEGSVIWRNEPNRHVAIDIGKGFLVEMGREGYSVEIHRIGENLHRFDGSGEHRNVDYCKNDKNMIARNI